MQALVGSIILQCKKVKFHFKVFLNKREEICSYLQFVSFVNLRKKFFLFVRCLIVTVFLQVILHHLTPEKIL